MPGRWTLTATARRCAASPGGPGRSTRPRTTRARTTEDRLGLAAELAADDLADLGVGERRDLVEELEQLVAVRGRQQVEAQGQHLAQLDPGAAELLEGEARPEAHSVGRTGRRRDGAMK